MTNKTEVWIGLVEVNQRPGAGVLMDRNGAITNALAFAESEGQFREAIETALLKLGFDLIAVEDAEPLRVRQEGFEVSSELLELAAELASDRSPRFGAFHTWTAD